MIMKTLIASALLASFAFVSAGAQAADVGQDKSRAEVVSELAQAKADGQYTFGNLEYPAPIAQNREESRQQVQAELSAAKADGEVTFGNLSYPPEASANTNASRAEVQAELKDAKADGSYTFANLDYPPAPRG
jgi:hypothetical protein